MANSTLEILIQARDNASPTFKNVANSAQSMGKEVDAASKKMEAAGKGANNFAQSAQKIDSAGRQARIGLSSMAQAAQLVGVDISGITGAAASASDAIGDMTGAVGSLGLAAGAAGLALAAIALVVQKLQAQHDATVKTVIATDQYLDRMKAISATNAEASAQIQKIADSMVTLQGMGSANPLTKMFESFNAGKTQLDDFFASLDKGIVRLRSLPEIIQAQKQALDDMTWSARSGYDALEALRASSGYAASAAYEHQKALDAEADALGYVAAAARRLADAMGDTRADAIADYREGARSVAEMNTKAWHAKYEFKEGAGWVEKIGKNAQKASTSVSQMVSKLKGLVESALTPTAADPNMGNAWDEARKRFEAFATGTDLGAYGAEFQKMFEGLGMSAQQAADAFKNFSLFADPKNLNLVDFAPIIEQVKTQLDGMIGKANVTAEAMRQVWANLSPQQKAALAEQGIDNASEAITALVDPTSQAKTQVQQLGAAMAAIPNVVTTTFNVIKDAAETAVKEFREVLDKFIADYGSVTVSINAETSANAPAPATTYEQYNDVPFLAEGGMIRSEGLAYLHAGERVLTRDETRAYNNTTNYGGITVILPNVTNGNEFLQQLNRALGKRAAMRGAMGI